LKILLSLVEKYCNSLVAEGEFISIHYGSLIMRLFYFKMIVNLAIEERLEAVLSVRRGNIRLKDHSHHV